jgi:hypothetical protein
LSAEGDSSFSYAAKIVEKKSSRITEFLKEGVQAIDKKLQK